MYKSLILHVTLRLSGPSAPDKSDTSAHLFVHADHVVDFFHVLLVLVGVGHVLADVEQVPEPTESEIPTERAPPEYALQVSAQVEMVQAAHSADQPQQIRERFALVAVAAVIALVVVAAPIAAAAAVPSEDTFAHNSR